jgi:hypothetical protein
MYLRIELLGHYIELGAKEPEQPQVVVVDPGGQLTAVSSETASPYVGFYQPGFEEEVEDGEEDRKQ